MFCSKCGQKIKDNVKFCSSCGANIGNTQASDQHVTSTPVATVTAKSFRCNGCGASLKIPKNTRGVMTCPSCKTECVLDGLIKNAEIAAKENITGGIPLTATSATLHRALISLLDKSISIPLDVFDKIEIIREEHYCVSAYLFSCNGTASFTYETGVEKRQTYNRDRGDYTEDVTKYHTEWVPGSSNASITETIFASGNKKLVSQIQESYCNTENFAKELIDIEELSFPPDVETYGYNLPELAAFNECVKPLLEKSLSEKIKSSPIGFVRNVSMGGSNIQKEVVRVFLGLYRIAYKYNDQEYSMWATGSGEGFCSGYEGLPLDVQRKADYNERISAYYDADIAFSDGTKKIGCLFPALAGIPAALCLFGFTFSADVGLVWLLITAVFSIPLIFRIGKNNKLEHKLALAKDKIKEFDAPRKNAVEQFRNTKKAFAGMYSKVSNDPEAF